MNEVTDQWGLSKWWKSLVSPVNGAVCCVRGGGGIGGLDYHPIKIIGTWCKKIWREIFVMHFHFSFVSHFCFVSVLQKEKCHRPRALGFRTNMPSGIFQHPPELRLFILFPQFEFAILGEVEYHHKNGPHILRSYVHPRGGLCNPVHPWLHNLKGLKHPW